MRVFVCLVVAMAMAAAVSASRIDDLEDGSLGMCLSFAYQPEENTPCEISLLHFLLL